MFCRCLASCCCGRRGVSYFISLSFPLLHSPSFVSAPIYPVCLSVEVAHITDIMLQSCRGIQIPETTPPALQAALLSSLALTPAPAPPLALAPAPAQLRLQLRRRRPRLRLWFRMQLQRRPSWFRLQLKQPLLAPTLATWLLGSKETTIHKGINNNALDVLPVIVSCGLKKGGV